MALTSSDIIVYGSANMQESDSGTTGGDISTTTRIILSNNDWPNNINDSIKVNLAAAGDAPTTVVIYGRDINGKMINESFLLPGTTTIVGSKVFKNILKITTSKSNINVITFKKVSDSSTLYILPIATRKVIRPFYNINTDISSGDTLIYYEKIFIKNINSTDSLLNTKIIDNGGDSNGYITFALDNAINSTNSTTNRLTAPTNLGASGFSSSEKSLFTETGTNDLSATQYIGIWLKLTLPAGASAEDSFWKLNISGSIK